MQPHPLDGLLSQVANTYGLPFDLWKAQGLHESNLDPAAFRYEHDFYLHYIARNPEAKAAPYGPLAACSYGTHQIMLEVAAELGFDGRPEQLFDPRVGMAWAARKMRALWQWAGGRDTDYLQALAAYNGGTVGNNVAPFRNRAYAEAVYALAGKAL